MVTLFKRSTSEPLDGVELEAAVEGLLAALADNPALDEWGLVEALTDLGVTRITAMRVVTFAPVAFGRMFLQESGLSVFPPKYEVRGKKSKTRKPLRYEDTPEYVAARAVAERADRNAPCVMDLARRSGEVDAALELEHEGSIAGVRFTSAVITWDIL